MSNREESEMETWKDVPDTKTRLQVSDLGRIRSFMRKEEGNILKATEDTKGYLRLNVTIDRQRRCYKVHRLVAQMFLSNPDDKKQVNHIDGNKGNNAASNLEWVTNEENARHAILHGLWEGVFAASQRTNDARKTPIKAVDVKNGNVLQFESVSAAERYFNNRHISDVLNGLRSTAAGQYFYRLQGDAGVMGQ